MELDLQVRASDARAEDSLVPSAQSVTQLRTTLEAPVGALRMFTANTRGNRTVVVFLRAEHIARAEEPEAVTLRPRVRWRNIRTVDIEFDDATVEWLRRSDPEDAAGAVATEPVVDPRTGKPRGIRITGVSPGSPADAFDVKPGDILVSVDDQPVHSRAELIRIVRGLDPSVTRVKVVIDRNGREIVFLIDPRDAKARRASRALPMPRDRSAEDAEEPSGR